MFHSLKTSLLIGLLAMATTVSANNIETVTRGLRPGQKPIVNASEKVAVQTTTLKKSAAASEKTATVHWKIVDMDEVSWRNYFDFINVETKKEYEFYTRETWGDAVIPAGCYDIFFYGYNGVTIIPTLIVREHVNIEEDYDLSIAMSEAVDKRTMQLYDENGKEMLADIVNEYGGVVKEGALDYVFCSFYLILEGFGIPVGHNWLNYDYSEDTDCSPFVVYTSPLSERITVACSGITNGKNGNLYQFYAQSNNHSELTLKNDPTKYVKLTEQFKRSPAGRNCGQKMMSALASRITYNGEYKYNYAIYNTFSDLSEGEIPTIYAYCHEPEDLIKTLVTPGIVDCSDLTHNIVEWENPDGSISGYEWDEGWATTNYGQQEFVTSNGIEYINSGHSVGGGYGFEYPENPNENFMEYPGHPRFSYQANQITDVYGESCPITIIEMDNQFQDYLQKKYLYLDATYVGRRGEIRTTDLRFMDVTLKYNGEAIESDQFYAADYFRDNDTDGLWEGIVVNSNVEVDGLEGKNITTFSLDTRNDDYWSPTLQMLDFRNDEDQITDRFESAELGVLQFACGDFNYRNIDDYYYFDCKPVSVKTEYSVYQEEDWSELTSITEKEEYFCRPAFGYFYSGSLAEVDTPSETGWYDLRITLTDETGNTQVQTISPAFKIGNGTPTTIHTIEQIDDNNIYTLQGQKAQKQLNELGAGMYVVGGKKVVKI